MRDTTPADRQNELRTLLANIDAHPERDWTQERKRILVLKQMVADEDAKV